MFIAPTANLHDANLHNVKSHRIHAHTDVKPGFKMDVMMDGQISSLLHVSSGSGDRGSVKRQLQSQTALWTLSALALAACGGGGGGGGGPAVTDDTGMLGFLFPSGADSYDDFALDENDTGETIGTVAAADANNTDRAITYSLNQEAVDAGFEIDGNGAITYAGEAERIRGAGQLHVAQA